jgi:hypothetical protein
MQPQEFQKRSELTKSISRSARVWATVIDFVGAKASGYGDRALIDNLSFSSPRAPSKQDR